MPARTLPLRSRSGVWGLRPAVRHTDRGWLGALVPISRVALAHLARSGLDVAAYGPAVGQLDLTGKDPVAVVGPTDELHVVPSTDLRDHVSAPGRFVVFDPRPLREAFARQFAPPAPISDLTRTERRSA